MIDSSQVVGVGRRVCVPGVSRQRAIMGEGHGSSFQSCVVNSHKQQSVGFIGVRYPQLRFLLSWLQIT